MPGWYVAYLTLAVLNFLALSLSLGLIIGRPICSMRLWKVTPVRRPAAASQRHGARCHRCQAATVMFFSSRDPAAESNNLAAAAA